jgi:PAS domain S-box-containing protein
LISPNLETKLLWDRFQWLTDTFLVILPFLIFCVQFSEYKLRHPRLAWGYLLGVPILFTVVLLTDDLHHLLYPNPHLSMDSPFPELKYDFTFVVYGYTLLYVYGANFYGISLLIRRALQPHNEHRLQYWTIAIGFLIPVALSILSLFNLYVSPQRDLSPFSLAIGNLVVTWGLFRYGLFGLVPIARERVLENMTDAIIVVDGLNRVVDINQAALAIAGGKSAGVIGHPVQEAFAGWPHLVEQVLNVEDATGEVSARVRREDLIYELSVSTVRDQGNRLLGRVFVAHDITRPKMLEERYRQLSEELEQRVRERTEELRESTERYRAVVENQTEFIVRWNADGVRTFANEAYRRYFGLTPEQAASSSFMPLVAEEDRNAVEGKLSRLLSGISASETDVHRVIKPDGNIGWQEWVDQAIYNETGQIMEFQSVGRDITQRKQAEEALREKTEELERFFNSALDLLCIADTDGYFRRLNHEWEKVLGYRMADLEGRRFLDLVHPDDQQVTLAVMAKLDAQQEVLDFTNRYRCKDGTHRWIEWRSIPHGKLIYATARDITERKRIEEALREEEMKFRSLFEASHDIIMLLDRAGNILDINHRGEQLTGYLQSDLRRMNVFRHLLPPEDQGIVREVIEDLVQGKARVYEYRWRTKAGGIIHFEGSSVPHVSVDGEFLSTLCMLRDITARKRMEEALAASEAKLRTLFAAMNDVVLVIDRNGVYRKIAPTNPDLLYKPPDELLGKTLQDVFPAEQAETFIAVIRQVVETQQTTHIEYQLVINDRVVWFDTSISPMDAGNTLWMARDITDRKRIETALQESEKRYRDLVEFSPVAMTVHMEGRIVYINPAGARLWGADTPDEVLGRSPLEFVHPEYYEQVTERIEQIHAVEQSPPPIEVKNTRLDGQILYTAGTGIPITYAGKPAILSVVLDITERKLAEERLRELTRQLIAAQEAERKRIAQELHDELGQAMTAISLDLGGIEKALPAEASRELRERLIDARSMAHAVDEQISEMALDLRPSLLDDLGLLPALQWYLNRYSQRTGIEVATNFEDLESRLPDEVETTLYRVIQEALTNIARHAQAGKVLISLDRSAAAVTASIQDNGRGFDVDGAQGPAASPGSMGLLGIKDRVSTLGGTVDIRSERGEGTRIQIELPIQKSIYGKNTRAIG